MGNVNKVVVSGNLTRDPELRTFGEDGKVANLGIAVNRQRFDKTTNEYVNEVSFFDVTVWGNFGALAARKLKKGDSCTIAGRLEQQNWEKDGEKKSKVVIIAEDVDSEGFFRPQSEDNAVESGATPATAAPGADAEAAGTDDDIPF